MTFKNWQNTAPENTSNGLLLPEAAWNLTGLFLHDSFILDFIRKIRDHLHVLPAFQISREEIDKTINACKTLGLGCRLTFSNRFISENDLDDPECNYLLDQLNERGARNNGVIVASDILADYIRKTYPNLHLMASIIKVTCEKGTGDLSYYRSLESAFDAYVVDVDDNDNYDLLKNLDTSKAEILVNSCCVYHCPFKAEHYDLLVKVHDQKSGVTMDTVLEYQKKNCKAYPIGRQLGETLNHCLTLKELQTLYHMGFRLFKLQGRQTTSLTGILYDICHYVFENQQVGPLVFHSFA
jgi:collagenase-like PrtC family protease